MQITHEYSKDKTLYTNGEAIGRICARSSELQEFGGQPTMCYETETADPKVQRTQARSFPRCKRRLKAAQPPKQTWRPLGFPEGRLPRIE